MSEEVDKIHNAVEGAESDRLLKSHLLRTVGERHRYGWYRSVFALGNVGLYHCFTLDSYFLSLYC